MTATISIEIPREIIHATQLRLSLPNQPPPRVTARGQVT